ncbi:MAG: sulfite exporter TauE/SafE family protein [Clostridia bacterium]|nr:sulfite exporter TauE/SafE family protein [Clostridia bacterium]
MGSWQNIFGDNVKEKLKNIGGGVIIGVVNGLLGAGGGMLAVPLLKKSGLEQKEAHATSIAVILPLSVISAATYLLNGSVTLSDSIPYLLPGAIGAVIGAVLLGKISDKWLRRVFGVFMIWAGIRLLMR